MSEVVSETVRANVRMSARVLFLRARVWSKAGEVVLVLVLDLDLVLASFSFSFGLVLGKCA